mgnify:CR=1 FL=1
MNVYIRFAVIVVLGILIATIFDPQSADAKQTSLDARIFEAFERVDERTTVHKRDASAMRARLDQITVEMAALRNELSVLEGAAGDENLRSQRRLVRGKMIKLSAEYLSQSFQLLDSASDLISANLSDLAELAAEVRKSGRESGGVLKLQNRIQQNVSAGQSMRAALVELKNWTRQDPNLVGQFKSLRRIMGSLDRRISVDKARVQGRDTDPTGAVTDRRLDALDQTLDRLGDMYTQVTTEKQALLDMKEELSIAIQLGRLEMTQEVANHAIPNFEVGTGSDVSAGSLSNIASTISDLNVSLVEEADLPNIQPSTVAGDPVDVDLAIDGFNNF